MRDALAIAGVSAPDAGKFIRCPLHSENSASFHLLGDPGRESGYKCFGCDAKGGVADFLVRMKLARDEADAARLLEAKFGPDDQARVTASFVYTSDGKPVARVDRKEPGRNGKAKEFLPYVAQGQTFSEKPGLNGTKMPLYHQEEVIAAAAAHGTIMLVEGEGKGDDLRRFLRDGGKSSAVTTISGGANAAMLPSHISDFAGAGRVYVLCDSDKPGRECAGKRAALIANANPGTQVYTVDLFRDKSDGSDIKDWLRTHSLDDFAQVLRSAIRINAAVNEPTDGVLSFSDLIRRNTEHVDWCIEGLLRDSGMMLLASKPKAGKSTLARNIARCVASGEPFLGRRVRSGKVLWIGLEEPLSHLLDQAEVMGLDILPIAWVIERPSGDENVWLEAAIIAHKPALVIIDTIGRFSNVEDINHYSQVTRATQPMLEMRTKYGCAFLLLHHNNHADKTLGSVMWEGVVDTILSLTRSPEGDRFLKTLQRSGSDMPEIALQLDEDSGLISSPAPKSLVDQRAAEQRILDLLRTPGAAFTREYLANHCGRRAHIGRDAVDALVSSGIIHGEGSGVNRRARVYSLVVSPNSSDAEPDEESQLLRSDLTYKYAEDSDVWAGVDPALAEHSEDSAKAEDSYDSGHVLRDAPAVVEPTRILGGRMCSICRRVGVCVQRDEHAVCRECLKVQVAS